LARRKKGQIVKHVSQNEDKNVAKCDIVVGLRHFPVSDDSQFSNLKPPKAGLGTIIFCINVGHSSTQSVNRYACQIIVINK
jgi:hypothetical protein